MIQQFNTILFSVPAMMIINVHNGGNYKDHLHNHYCDDHDHDDDQHDHDHNHHADDADDQEDDADDQFDDDADDQGAADDRQDDNC